MRSAVFSLLIFVLISLSSLTCSAEADVDVSSYLIWCRVFVTEQGIAKSVEVRRVVPHTENDAAIGEAVKAAVLTWTFRPNMKNGKPVAGYVTIPVHWN